MDIYETVPTTQEIPAPTVLNLSLPKTVIKTITPTTQPISEITQSSPEIIQSSILPDIIFQSVPTPTNNINVNLPLLPKTNYVTPTSYESNTIPSPKPIYVQEVPNNIFETVSSKTTILPTNNNITTLLPISITTFEKQIQYIYIVVVIIIIIGLIVKYNFMDK